MDKPESADNFPTVALAQMVVVPGRPDLNVPRMCGLIDRARDQGAKIVSFSEMCVAGYLLGDQWEVDALVRDYAAWSDVVRDASVGLTVLFGNVVVDDSRIGEDGRLRKYNAVLVCHDGMYCVRPDVPDLVPYGAHPKTLQPNYRFFDDDRHFFSSRKLAEASADSWRDWHQPYRVTWPDGESFAFGVQLCEDMWCDDYRSKGDILDNLAVYQRRGARAVFNLSASPWTWQKNDKRNRTVHSILERSPVPYFYVNHVGAQNNGKNIIVFDGDTTAYDAKGAIVGRAEPWRETLLICNGRAPVATPYGELESIFEALLSGLRHLDELRGGRGGYLVGASGGIDSSLVTCLLTLAFGPQRVHAVNMPTRFNSDVTQANAQSMCESLGVDYLSLPIQDLYEHVARAVRDARFGDDAGAYTRLVDENIQARIRGADVLSGLAAKFGLVFTNNGNKTEVALGYATLYGDVNGAIAPIADLFKTQVFALAKYLNEERFGAEVIPANLYDGTIVPSAELSEAQDVNKGLGDPIKYGYHDAVLRQMIEYRVHLVDLLEWWDADGFFARIGWSDPQKFFAYFPTAQAWLEDLEWLDRQLRLSYFKRVQAPPIVIVSKRAFGFDLRESQLTEYMPRAYAGLRERVLASKWRAPSGEHVAPADP